LPHGRGHGQPSGLVNVDLVDGLRRNDANPQRDCVFHYALKEHVSLLCSEQLRIGQAKKWFSVRDDNRSGYHWAGQRATSGLVDSGYSQGAC
jgi:hypothetical protein